jgi:hypothetical protein
MFDCQEPAGIIVPAALKSLLPGQIYPDINNIKDKWNANGNDKNDKAVSITVA